MLLTGALIPNNACHSERAQRAKNLDLDSENEILPLGFAQGRLCFASQNDRLLACVILASYAQVSNKEDHNASC
jgi:hypothetical protein